MGGNADTDSRRSERKRIRKTVVLVVEMGEETATFDAATMDVSKHGVRVQANGKLKPGQVLHLMQPDNPDELVSCLVVWTSDVSSDKKGEAGLEFLRSYTAPLES